MKLKLRKLKLLGNHGRGRKIAEIIETMKDLKQRSEVIVEIDVYLSKAADIMLKFYRLDEELKKSFAKVTVESNSNSPLSGGSFAEPQIRVPADFSCILQYSS